MYGGGWKPTDALGYRERQGQPAAGWAERADRRCTPPGVMHARSSGRPFRWPWARTPTRFPLTIGSGPTWPAPDVPIGSRSAPVGGTLCASYPVAPGWVLRSVPLTSGLVPWFLPDRDVAGAVTGERRSVPASPTMLERHAGQLGHQVEL